ncbi:phosphonate C-P lyase system protein PhnH [Labrys wisconsinensis]|uniref:Alpha-D-ribose 1-methylphosphonate 5-triphosphate synthase subunit PhnH n=1 Tax=Labrys wisconsinensis TaxID=425677 RepID=A0ABU0JFK1_9HYPH|nr:phosphonate C-P lyase system protein PhnH [Labrys wisconsinensis]MDQ0473065.1 alpha-D-ribose 1-methylphosphonate 5-triphosphate synthase subunit PhnH [Labrys wisconsinensis]
MNAAVFPVPDADERRDNATFEAVMWAMARPGTARLLPDTGLLPVALALVDLETRIHCDDAGLREPLARTGAAFVALEEADHLFLSGDLTAAVAASVAAGSALYPDQGATVVASVTLAGGRLLRLTGPGVDGAVTIAPAIAPAFWAARARIPYPAGFELVLVEGRRVVCLPRSTLVEVL